VAPPTAPAGDGASATIDPVSPRPAGPSPPRRRKPPAGGDAARAALDAWLRSAPGEDESARRAAAPYDGMTADERLAALAELNALVDAVLGGRPPETADGERPFWMHWKDPALGRPR
jgi:hypothetical protein